MTKKDQKQANMEGKLNISLKDKNCITKKLIKQDKGKKGTTITGKNWQKT